MQNWKNSFKKKGRPISKASLPDIIFILLFFFMLVTVFKDYQVEIGGELQEATELNKLGQRTLINHIYIGHPKRENLETVPRIQINDAFIALYRIQEAVHQLDRARPSYLLPKVRTSLEIDQSVKMGIVNEVKKELRKANKLRVNYAAKPRF